MENIERYKNALENILATAKNRDPGDVIKSIFDLAAVMGDEISNALLDSNPQYLEYRPIFKKAYYEFYAKNEISESKKFLKEDNNETLSFREMANPLSMFVYKRTGDLCRWLDFHDCRRIVMVGSGWLPFTLFYFNDHTEVPELVGLDTNPEAIVTANNLAERLGYTRVRTELQNGFSYYYSEAQIIYVVSMVSPMSAVLTRIADTAPDNLQLIVTEPQSLGQLWGEALKRTIDPRFEVVRQGPVRAALSRDVLLSLRPNVL